MAGIYRTIAYELEAELGQMRLEGKLRLPSEDELCRKFSCSRQTVRSALDLMVDKGLIVKKRGSGSYISDKAKKKSNKVFLIVEDEDEYTNRIRSYLHLYGRFLRQGKRCSLGSHIRMSRCSTYRTYRRHYTQLQ